MRFSASVLARLADIGVPAGMRAEDAKHVRFCNLATLCGLVCAVVFWLLEIPVIADWGALGVREAGIILVRGAGAALFALPLWLNRHHRHAARAWGSSACPWSSC